MRIGILISLLTLIAVSGFSQSYYYKTRSNPTSGSWNGNSVWQRSLDGVSFSNTGTPPTRSNAIEIRIESGYAMSVPSGTTVSGVKIVLNGSLTIATGGTLQLYDDGSTVGNDLVIGNSSALLTVNGTFQWRTGATISNPFGAARMLFQPNSILDFAYATGGCDLPPLTLDPTSTLQINSVTGDVTFNSTWNTSFGNITSTTPSGTMSINWQGNLTSVAGNLTIAGTTRMYLATSESYTLSIGGGLSILGTSRMFFGDTGTATVTIGGDLTFESTHGSGSFVTGTGTSTINVNGSFFMDASSGRFHMANAGTTGIGSLNLYGDFTLLSGRLDEIGTDPTMGNINFLGSGYQTYVNTGTITGYINYFVESTSTLDVGTYDVDNSSPGTFTLNGGTLILGSLDALGALASTGSNGNLRMATSRRTYNSGSTIVYQGAGAQYMSSGHPTSAGITTIIDNPSGVTLISSPSLSGNLVLESGDLVLNGNTLTMTSNTISYNTGLLSGSSTSRITVAGTLAGSMGELRFNPAANTLGTLTMNRAGGASVDINQALNLVTALNLTTGDINNNTTITVSNGLLVTKYETSSIIGNPLSCAAGETYNLFYRTTTSSSSPGPYVSLYPTNEFPTDQSHVGDLTIQTGHSQDSFNFDRDITVNGTVTLNRGRFNLGTYNMYMNGASWIDNSGVMAIATGTLYFNGITSVDGSATPVFTCPVVVNTGKSVSFLRDFTFQRDLTIQSGSTWSVNGFTMNLTATAAQVINANGASFAGIAVNKAGSSTVTLTSQLNMGGGLSFIGSSTNVNFISNGNLVLLSSSDAANATQGYIYRLTGTNKITGNVVVNRYISGEGRIYRYISSPLSNGTVADLKDDMLVQGSFSDPSPTTVICGYNNPSSTKSLFYYNETVGGSSAYGYVAYPLPGTTTGASQLVPGRGYATWIRTCLAPTFLDYTGLVNQGNVTPTITYTNTGNASADGWNLVGNPYPCAIDWNTGINRTNIVNGFAITDNGAGVVQYYDPGVTEDVPNGYIGIGQGFWIIANAANPTITFTESSKVTSIPEFYRAETIPSLIVSISNSKMEDKVYIKTVDKALPTKDQFDFPKLYNPEGMINLGIITEDNNEMAINAVSSVSCGSSYPLKTAGLTAGTYTFKIDTRGFFNQYNFVLIDKVLNKETILTEENYSFTITSDTTDVNLERFVIRVNEKLALQPVQVASADVCAPSSKISVTAAQAGVNYSVWNSLGQKLTDFVAANNSDLTLEVDQNLLKEGTNSLLVKASTGCQEPIAVTSLFNVVKSFPTVTKVTNTFACKSGSVQLKAESSMSNVTYNWYERESDVTPIASGDTFETPELSKNKTYYVEAISGVSGCASTRTQVTTDITVFTPPTMLVDGVTLASSYNEGNQWYYEGALMTKETAPTLTMTLSGTYALVVNFKGCEYKFEHNLENAGVSGIVLFPNPASDKITLSKVPDDIDRILLINAVGQQVSNVFSRGDKFDGQVFVKDIPDGVYMFIVIKGNSKVAYRFIKNSQ